METLNYTVTPEAGIPGCYYLDCKEKNYRFYVIKMFENDYQTHYNFEFRHLDDEGNRVRRNEYKAFAQPKGITRADNMRAAIWFLTKYFSFRELNYELPADEGFTQGSVYPVLGRHVQRSVISLRWD